MRLSNLKTATNTHFVYFFGDEMVLINHIFAQNYASCSLEVSIYEDSGFPTVPAFSFKLDIYKEIKDNDLCEVTVRVKRGSLVNNDYECIATVHELNITFLNFLKTIWNDFKKYTDKVFHSVLESVFKVFPFIVNIRDMAYISANSKVNSTFHPFNVIHYVQSKYLQEHLEILKHQDSGLFLLNLYANKKLYTYNSTNQIAKSYLLESFKSKVLKLPPLLINHGLANALNQRLNLLISLINKTTSYEANEKQFLKDYNKNGFFGASIYYNELKNDYFLLVALIKDKRLILRSFNYEELEDAIKKNRDDIIELFKTKSSFYDVIIDNEKLLTFINKCNNVPIEDLTFKNLYQLKYAVLDGLCNLYQKAIYKKENETIIDLAKQEPLNKEVLMLLQEKYDFFITTNGQMSVYSANKNIDDGTVTNTFKR